MATITTMTKTKKIITMADPALYRLLAWLSPSYPVGAFAYSHGLEWAVETGQISDQVSMRSWIDDLLRFGGGWSDAVLFANAHALGGDMDALIELNDYALALAPSTERYLETSAQGTAFLKVTRDAWGCDVIDQVSTTLGRDVAYPIAVAIAAAGHGIDKSTSLHAFLHGVVANLVSAGVRLIPLGQTDGQHALAELESPVSETAAQALNASIDEIGGIAMLSDIAAMKHETQYTRLFRS